MRTKIKVSNCIDCNKGFDSETKNYCKGFCVTCYNRNYKKGIKVMTKTVYDWPVIPETSAKALRRENKEVLKAFVDTVERNGGWITSIDAYRLADLFLIYYDKSTRDIDIFRIDQQLAFMWNYIRTL